MVWENQMVDMVKHLNQTIDKSSPAYKKKKKQMMAERRAYIKQKKMEIMERDGSKALASKGNAVTRGTSPLQIRCTSPRWVIFGHGHHWQKGTRSQLLG